MEGFAKITLPDGREMEMTPENTHLYRHIGRFALFDHIFFITGEAGGIYFWQHHHMYQTLAALVVENECPLHLNIQEVSEIDQRYYLQHNTRDLGDTIPEGWV